MDASIYEFNTTILIITMLFSSIIIVVLGAYVYVNGQKGQIYGWFIALLGLLFAWDWSHMMRHYAPNVTSLYILQMIEFLAIAFIGPVTLAFARSYRGWINRGLGVVRLAFIGGVLIAALILTNPIHKMIFTQVTIISMMYGKLYYLTSLFSLACFMGATYYFIRGVKNPSVYWKKQLSNVGGGALLLAIAGVIEVSGVVQLNIELPLLVLPLALILLGVAVMKYQFMDILPYALSEAVNFVDDGYMVFSIDGSLEDFNKRFFGRIISMDRCQNMDGVISALGRLVDNKVALNNLRESLSVRKNHYISGELLLEVDRIQRHLQYTTKAINDNQGMKIATIITFHDLSDLHHLYEVLEERKTQLMTAKEKLEQHIEKIQELTVETEGNILMAEVHDTLGHSMTEVLTLLEKCAMILGDESPDKIVGAQVIEDALGQSRDSLAEIRAAVGRFRKMGVEL